MARRSILRSTERLEPVHFVLLRLEPSEGRPLDEVIEREQAPHQHLRRCILPATVANIRDAQRQIGGLAGQQYGARAAGEDGPLVLNGELLLDERVPSPCIDLGLRVLDRCEPVHVETLLPKPTTERGAPHLEVKRL